LTIPRIYFPIDMEKDDLCKLGEENLRYVKTVLRMKKGDHLVLFDGAGWEYETVIRQLFADGISVKVLKKRRIPDKSLKIALFQALPKANKMDFLIQKATELGADSIFPFRSARSVPRLTADKARSKILRWRNIAIEAARQCGRADIPEVDGILSYDEAIARPPEEDLKVIFWEEESARSIKDVLSNEEYNGVKEISVIVGPEGGFSGEEVDAAVGKGFISASLGRNILKVETAVLAILSIIQYEKGIFGEPGKGG